MPVYRSPDHWVRLVMSMQGIVLFIGVLLDTIAEMAPRVCALVLLEGGQVLLPCDSSPIHDVRSHRHGVIHA